MKLTVSQSVTYGVTCLFGEIPEVVLEGIVKELRLAPKEMDNLNPNVVQSWSTPNQSILLERSLGISFRNDEREKVVTVLKNHCIEVL